MKRYRLTLMSLTLLMLISVSAGVAPVYAEEETPASATETIERSDTDADVRERRGQGRFQRGDGERRGPGPRRGIFDWFMGPPPPQRDGEDEDWRGQARFWAENRERMDHLRREQPELAEVHMALSRVEAQIREAVMRARPTWDEEETQEAFREGIEPLLIERFDLDMKRQRLEIQYMQERIDRIRKVLDRKDELKDAIITRDLDQMIERGLRPERRSWFGFGRRGQGGPPPKDD